MCQFIIHIKARQRQPWRMLSGLPSQAARRTDTPIAQHQENPRLTSFGSPV